MRPSSILWFERIYLVALALGALHAVVNFDASLARLESEPSIAILGGASSFVVAIMVFSFLISLLFWFLIARKGSNFAKWILVLFTAIGLFMLPGTLEAMTENARLVTITLTALQVIAIAFLFRRDAREFLASDPTSPALEERQGVNLQ
ncbi:hypothetical protein K3163_00895 [Qipengyuania sp. 1NDW9]|uniref:hypothetical protein n=1 Tax=Qipengyuania xiapuensis TaxID=2867236 RepID=UPI001C873301|nr:hypothetical protein [Qipengyuania xiapuensis]MBX7491760.1 hypothetical protein [Qipengyuania xiapuensis]